MIRDKKGFVTLISLIVMLVITIIGTGLLIWINYEIKTLTLSRNSLEAEYAAEAGAKRAITEFNMINMSQQPDWSWLGSDRAFINDVNSERYKVIIFNSSDPNKTPVIPDSTGTNRYTILSTGTVGGITRTVSVSVSILQTGGANIQSPFYYATYSGNNIEFSTTAAINGADYCAHNQVKGNNGGSGNEVADPGVVFPPYQTLTTYFDPTRPIDSPLFKGNKYVLSNSLNNTTLVVNGNLDVVQNVNFNNVILYVDGNITFNGGGVNFNGTNFIVANGNITAKDDINFGNSVVVSYNVLDVQSVNINGCIVSSGNELFKGSTNITYNKSVVDSFIGGKPLVTVDSNSWSLN